MLCFRFGFFVAAFLAMSTITITEGVNDDEGCISPQYAELGHTAFIHCSFPRSFNALYWYNTSEVSKLTPVIGLVNSEKVGLENDEGKYDILTNGSLVITNINAFDENIYKAICLDSRDIRSTYFVTVIVTVFPKEAEPTIDGCNAMDVCVLQRPRNEILECTFSSAKPPVNLEWLVRTSKVDVNISSSRELLPDYRHTFGTVSTISLADFESRLFAIVVCRSYFEPSNMKSEKIALLDFSIEEDLLSFPKETVYFNLNSTVSLHCLNKVKNGNYIWKVAKANNFEMLAYRIPSFGNSDGANDFYVTEYGDLIINLAGVSHEGIYACLFDDGLKWNIKITQLIWIVPPSTPTVGIEECEGGVGCTIYSSERGELTCYLNNFRPNVSLHWSVHGFEDRITVDSKTESVVEASGLFNVSSTIKYKVSEKSHCHEELQLRCGAKIPVSRSLQHTETAVVLVLDNVQSCTDETKFPGTLQLVAMISAAAVILITGAILLVCKLRRGERCSARSQNVEDNAETVPLRVLSKDPDIHGKRDYFIKQLEVTYIFFSNENDIYIPSNLLRMNPSKASSDDERFTPLDSYHDLFRMQSITKKKLLVIEGEAGCGKSVLGRFLVKEWLNKKSGSPMQDFSIVILLPLAYLNPGESVWQSIMTQLMPSDCNGLDCSDIANILGLEEKIVLILDGFDEYIERNKGKNVKDDVSAIMNNKKLRNAFKILLTRSTSYLRRYGDTKFPIIRLDKFSQSQIFNYATQIYLSKEYIFEQLKDEITRNDVLEYFCQIPFFLEIICDLYETNRSVTAPTETVTDFFGRIMELKYKKAFLKNTKFNDPKATYTPSRMVSQFAFECILADENAWSENYLCEKGITNEEVHVLKTLEVIVNTKFYGDSSLSEVPDRHTLCIWKFRHKIYQYYIAAHFLATLNESELQQKLKLIDFLTCQYLLYYTCGLNTTCLPVVLRCLLQEEDLYPFPMRDCFAYCVREAKVQSGSQINVQLQELSLKEHGVEVLEKDSRQLRKAKSSLLRMFEDQKIVIGSLRLVNVATALSETHLSIEGGLTCRLPLVRTLVITDFARKLNEQDIMETFKKFHYTIEELVVYSCIKPKALHKDILQILQKRQYIVCWIHFFTRKGAGTALCYYPSVKFNCWMSPADATIVRLMRLFKKTRITEEEAVEISISQGWGEALKQVGFSRRLVSPFETQQYNLMDKLKEILDIWQKVDDASMVEDVTYYKKKMFDKMRKVKILMKLDKFAGGVTVKDKVDEFLEGDVEEFSSMDSHNFESCRPREKDHFLSTLKALALQLQV